MPKKRRVCFQLQVRPECIAEYRARHAAVWPGMLAGLRDTGWSNYSLFMRADGLVIGYFETEDLDAAQAGMTALEVNSRWQEEMGHLFLPTQQAVDDGLVELTEVFNLDDQLAAAGMPLGKDL